MNEPREFTRRSERIEELVSRVENTGDPALRAVAQELLQAVIELHGVALDHILSAIADLPQGGVAIKQIAHDDLVSSVLSLHGINPLSLEERVVAALEKTNPQLRSHGGNATLDSIEDGVVHVTVQGGHGGCHSTADTMRNAVEDAIYQAAPEIVTIIAEEHPAPPQLVQLVAAH
jgi:Fe-S cluster biogenesis protein NfuA